MPSKVGDSGGTIGPRHTGPVDSPAKSAAGEEVKGVNAAEAQKIAQQGKISKTNSGGKQSTEPTLVATDKPALESRDFTAKALGTGAQKLTETVSPEQARTNLGLTEEAENEFIGKIAKAVQKVPQEVWKESPEKAIAMMSVDLFEIFMEQSKGMMEFSKLMTNKEFAEMDELRTQEAEAKKFTGSGENASTAKKVFGWVGAVVGVIAGAVAVGVATVGTAGTGTPAATGAYMALTGALIGLAKKTSDETGLTEKVAEKIVGPIIENLTELFGGEMTEEKAEQIAMIAIGITVTIIQVGFSLGSVAATSGANVAKDAAAAMDKIDDLVANANVADDIREGIDMTTTTQQQLQSAIQTAKNAENTTEALTTLRETIDSLGDGVNMTREFADEILDSSRTAFSEVNKLMDGAKMADNIDDVGKDGVQMTTQAKETLKGTLETAKDVESTSKALDSFRSSVIELYKAGEISEDFANELGNASQTMQNLISTIRNVMQGSAQAAEIATTLGEAATTAFAAVMKKNADEIKVIIEGEIKKNISMFQNISDRYAEKAKVIAEGAMELSKTASASGRGALSTQASVARNITV